MQTKLIILAVSLCSLLTHAASVGDYVESKKMSGKDKRGEFDIQYVQLKNPAGLEALTKVNTLIEEEAKSSICDEGETPEEIENLYSTTTQKVTFVSDRLLVYDANYDSYCGGAHPNAGIVSEMYDLKKAALLDIKSQVKDQKKFKMILVQAMKKAGRAAYDKEDEDGCRDLYTNANLEFFNVGLNPRELTVTPSFAHAAQACETAAKVPLKTLKGQALPGSLLEELIKGAK